MALHFDLCVNNTKIASFEAVRITSTEARPNPDDVNTYKVEVKRFDQDFLYAGQVEHRYGDEAFALVHRALGDMIAMVDDE